MAAILDLLLPPSCSGCGTEGVLVCERCRRPFERRLSEPPGAPIGLPGSLPQGLAQLEWCAAFTGPVRATLHALKYDGERRLAAPLAEWLAARWRRAGQGGELLVPVPVHADRLRQRGYDQAVLLCQETAGRLGLPWLPALGRRSATAAQHSLDRSARLRNVGGAFEVVPMHRGHLAGRWVVLVDDVVTTGSTMAGCAAALTAAGARAVSGLAVARER
jgi:ComF family protein